MYYFDDVLSAVDAHVGQAIFDNVLSNRGGSLLKGKTRLLVTNAVHLAGQCDKIILVKNGKVLGCDRYDSLMKNEECREYFKSFKTDGRKDSEMVVARQNSEKQNSELQQNSFRRKRLRKSLSRSISYHKQSSSVEKQYGQLSVWDDDIELEWDCLPDDQVSDECSRTVSKHISLKKQASILSENNKLIEDETAEDGHVTFKTISTYLSSIDHLWVVILIQIMYTAMAAVPNIWISVWAKASDEFLENSTETNETMPLSDHVKYLSIHSSLSIVEMLLFVARGWAIGYGAINAATLLHKKLLNSIGRAPMSFFETNPMGRIINRFSKDTDALDGRLAGELEWFIFDFASMLTSIGMMTYTVWWFPIPLIPILSIFYFLQRYYVVTANKIQRYISVANSPIYSTMGESFDGVSSIKIFVKRDAFLNKLSKQVNLAFKWEYLGEYGYRWFFSKVNFMGNFIILIGMIILVHADIEASWSALLISYLLHFRHSLAMTLWHMSHLENQLVSVERINEFIQVEQEADRETELDEELEKTNKKWPESGEIIFDGYSNRYRKNQPQVLKKIDLKINSGEKIGIVGRTGAGKSSLTVGLFRLIEPDEGRILIDGIDISKVGLSKLRSKLTIIPQEPVTWSGTIRYRVVFEMSFFFKKTSFGVRDHFAFKKAFFGQNRFFSQFS